MCLLKDYGVSNPNDFNCVRPSLKTSSRRLLDMSVIFSENFSFTSGYCKCCQVKIYVFAHFEKRSYVFEVFFRRYHLLVVYPTLCSMPFWTNRNWSPLHVAVYMKHKDVIELLIANHADLNYREKFNRTPLDLAKQVNASEEIIQLLNGSAQ
ncbi:hypothetical protein FDP41_008643 [Naegleria fowleri]|uniref:Uncharacterized protein n=1 Tax=Naegleria fowleri TaxID=5763 RepID=A0A6A5BIV9_NAEFO|nr:uncharacterized protein FDP41_008643 [Naegleria fowleri]KAF0972979.1 hypothetical protein FDP41_008643 [Naegleria fowleri]